MKLYYSPGACSLSPHIVLREAELEFELTKVDMRTRTINGGENYRAINPKAYVPALELDSGELMTEGPAIVQYLADLDPGAKLVPKPTDPHRYRAQEWLNYIASEIHKSFGPFVVPGASEENKERAQAHIHQRLEIVRGTLADQDYLVGNRYSVADIYMYVMLRWTAMFGMDSAGWPEFVAYRSSIEKRPAVRAALEAEGLKETAIFVD